MQKAELKKLKRVYATRTMVRIAMDPEKRDIRVLLRCQTRGKILMVCVFMRDEVAKGIKEPLYEIYLNPEGMEYITWRNERKNAGAKWLTGMLDNLDGINWDMCCSWGNYYKESNKKWWQNPEGKTTIQRMLGTKDKGWMGVIKWQRKVKAEQNRLKEERELAPWDAEMKLVPELPGSFDKWLSCKAFGKYFLFYNYKKGGAKEAYCSRCQRYVRLKGVPHHNEKAVCPACRAKAEYKVLSRAGGVKASSPWVEIIQRVRGGYVVRKFFEEHFYEKNSIKPYIRRKEWSRTMIMDDGAVRKYEYTLYKNKMERWCLKKDYRPEDGGYWGESQIVLYKKNMGGMKKGLLKRSSIGCWKILPESAGNYMAMEKKYPVIEMLAKIGMMRLAEDILKRTHLYKRMEIKIKGQHMELAKRLGIDRQRLDRLRRMGEGCTLEALEWMKLEKMQDTIWPDEMIKEFGENRIQMSDLGYLDPPVAPYIKKVWKYLKKQAEMADESIWQINNTWRDYVNMADRLRMDTKKECILMPKDLAAAHDEVVELLQKGEMEKEADEIRKKWKKVEKILSGLKKFNYEDHEFLVRAPEDILDIVREGRILRHCVHSCSFYFDRIEDHETYLFFLRRKKNPDRPWYTLEVEAGGNIRQKRTVGDNQNADLKEAGEFLKKWQQVFISRMTEKEKKEGKRADKKRMENYAQLRLAGNRVWHGRLAGQLLADVLEEDFMPVEMQAVTG